MKKIEELENRIRKLENNEYLTFDHIKKFFKVFFKVIQILVLIVIAVWVIYIFLVGLNCKYGFGNRVINLYHTLYG